MHLPRFNLLRNPQSYRKVLRKHRSREPVLGIIRQGNSLILRVNREEADHRTEGFHRINVHLWVYILQRNEPHAGPRPFLRVETPDNKSGASCHRLTNQIFTFLRARQADEDGTGAAARTDLQGGGCEGLVKRLDDRRVDDDSFGGHADLAALVDHQ